MPKTKPIAQSDSEIGKRFGELLSGRLTSGTDVENICRQLDLRRDTARKIELGHAPMPFRIAFKLWQQHSVSPLWLATGQGDWHMRADAFGWVGWINEEMLAQPFREGFAEIAGLFAPLGESDECPVALCKGMDRAKAALARGKMTEGQEVALRAAVAPWLK
jgi:hypothetical protein